jgi:hypothetical protein
MKIPSRMECLSTNTRGTRRPPKALGQG